MTTYDLIVNIPGSRMVELVREAKYELCLGVFTKAGGTAFSSTAINRIPLTEDNKYRGKWLGDGHYDYYMTATGPIDSDTEYSLFPVEFGDIYKVPQDGDAEIADETVPSLNGFRFQNETIASPVLYRTLKGAITGDLEVDLENETSLCPIPLWVPGTGQLEVLEDRAWLWLEARGSGNGVKWCHESIKLPVTFTTDKTTIVEIDADGKLIQPDIEIPKDPIDRKKAIDDPVGPKKAIDDPVDPKKAIDDLVDPKKAIDDPVDPANRVNPAGRGVPASRVAKPKRKPAVNGAA